MAFCSNCGAEVNGAFCPNCGTPMGSASAGPAAGSSAFATPPATAATGGMEPHIASALCYTPFAIGLICSIIFLVVAPFNQNKFVRFSAFQSLFLHLAIVVASIIISICFMVVGMILHVFAALLIPIWPLLWLGFLILFLFMMYKAFNNQKVKLPVIGDLADKQA